MKNFIQLMFCLAFSLSIVSCSSFCDDADCGNGTCNEDTESCDCNDFYEGNNCELEIRERFLGTWTAASLANPSAEPFDVAITSGVTVDEVQIQTPGLLQNFTMTGQLDADNNVNIPDFTISIASNTYNGTVTRIDETTVDLYLGGFQSNGNTFGSTYRLTKK